ncbi:hypothetical protein [Phormidium sp. CCY1219]|uniref:hypothetical protein n=1 Tax=Phormidium sp. CCY1219 TaxID=2886104 RepID=UPI002D1EC5CF|nr:hypothetical protein [Phormidium sp. CCY1219]MEB3827815.1 hypothetical protein [Phormidium sp. CCY1219]
MNSQNPERLKRKLEDLKTDIHRTQPLKRDGEVLQTLKSLSEQLSVWYGGLSNTGKGATIVVGGILAISVVSTVLNLIRLAVTLVIVGAVGYVGYKFFLASQSDNDPNP